MFYADPKDESDQKCRSQGGGGVWRRGPSVSSPPPHPHGEQACLPSPPPKLSGCAMVLHLNAGKLRRNRGCSVKGFSREAVGASYHLASSVLIEGPLTAMTSVFMSVKWKKAQFLLHGAIRSVVSGVCNVEYTVSSS